MLDDEEITIPISRKHISILIMLFTTLVRRSPMRLILHHNNHFIYS